MLWSSLGGLYLVNGDTVHAGEAFERSLLIKPNYAALSNLGSLKYEAGAYAVAADLYRHAAEIDPDDYRIWGNLGDALSALPATAAQAREPYRHAAQLAQRYVDIKTDDAHALSLLSWYRANLGEAEAARGLLARAEALGTEPGEVAFFGAQALALLGDAAGARERLARARAADVSAQAPRGVTGVARLCSRPIKRRRSPMRRRVETGPPPRGQPRRTTCKCYHGWLAIMTTPGRHRGLRRLSDGAKRATEQSVPIAILYGHDGTPSADPDPCTVDEGAMITWRTPDGVTSPFTIIGEKGHTAWGNGGMQLPSHPSGDHQEVKVDAMPTGQVQVRHRGQWPHQRPGNHHQVMTQHQGPSQGRAV